MCGDYQQGRHESCLLGPCVQTLSGTLGGNEEAASLTRVTSTLLGVSGTDQGAVRLPQDEKFLYDERREGRRLVVSANAELTTGSVNEMGGGGREDGRRVVRAESRERIVMPTWSPKRGQR